MHMPKRTTILLVLIATLPILLPLYNPAVEWGVTGMILGFRGLYISPLVILGFLGWLWQRSSKQLVD